MGIGNAHPPYVGLEGRGSLPLMGIGNLWEWNIPDDGGQHSLPLMGIGNRVEVDHEHGDLLSLPLMGIGNAPP